MCIPRHDRETQCSEIQCGSRNIVLCELISDTVIVVEADELGLQYR